MNDDELVQQAAGRHQARLDAPSADLTSELAKVRALRREGKHENAEQIVGRRTDLGEQLHQNREAAEQWTGGMDERVVPAATLLHERRHAVAHQIAVLQDELDQLDAAIDALTKVEG